MLNNGKNIVNYININILIFSKKKSFLIKKIPI